MKRMKQKRLSNTLSTGADENDKTDYHQLSIVELEREFLTDCNRGLSHADAETRLSADGPNQFSKSYSTPLWKIFIESFFSK